MGNDLRLQKLVSRLQNLSQNKDLSRERILEKVIFSLWEKIDVNSSELGYLGEFTSLKDEKEFLSERLKAYLDDFEFNKSTDLSDLRVVLGLELQHRRLMKRAEESKDKIDLILNEAITSCSKEMREVKTKLGISKSSRQGSQQTPFDTLQDIEKKALEFIKTHRDEYLWKCFSCGTIHLLARRHTAFDDECGVWSLPLIEFYNKGKITLDEVALVLETSPDHVRRVCKRKGIHLR